VTNAQKDDLVAQTLNIPPSSINPHPSDIEPIARQLLPGLHRRTRAFIKVQDGCDNRCTFCITTLARGSSLSRPVRQVIAEVQSALASGSQEIVLTGVHLGAWGQDLDQPRHLQDLIAALLGIPELPRLRVSSLEPWDLDAGFFSLWQDRRLCRHLHLPLQSGSAGVLRRMARKTTPETFAALLQAARAAIPDVAITTDLIAGFPGETDAEFEEGLRFVENVCFAGAHVFTYSARPGTAAARMPGQVHNYLRKERSAALRAVAESSARGYQQQFLGREMEVLWESAHPANTSGRWQLSGLTDNYLRVQAQAGHPIANQVTPVRLDSLNLHPSYFVGRITQYPDTI
jgi:threonylcarbamoyladenosine tRNA methylthiotransferase MtaB